MTPIACRCCGAIPLFGAARRVRCDDCDGCDPDGTIAGTVRRDPRCPRQPPPAVPSWPVPLRTFAREYLGADGDLWHILACGHVVEAKNTKHLGEPYRRRPCVECSGRPAKVQAPKDHHTACRCRPCDAVKS